MTTLDYRFLLPAGWSRLPRSGPSTEGSLSRIANALGGGARRPAVEASLRSLLTALPAEVTDVYLPTRAVHGLPWTLMVTTAVFPVPGFVGSTDDTDPTDDADPVGDDIGSPAADLISSATEVGRAAVVVEVPDVPGSAEAVPVAELLDAAGVLVDLSRRVPGALVIDLAGAGVVRTVERGESTPTPASWSGTAEESGDGCPVTVRYHLAPPDPADLLLVITGTVWERPGGEDLAVAEVEFFDALLTTFEWSGHAA